MEKFINFYQLAERYGVSHSTIKRWVSVGILPAPIKFGRSPLYARETIEEFEKKLNLKARKKDVRK